MEIIDIKTIRAMLKSGLCELNKEQIKDLAKSYAIHTSTPEDDAEIIFSMARMQQAEEIGRRAWEKEPYVIAQRKLESVFLGQYPNQEEFDYSQQQKNVLKIKTSRLKLTNPAYLERMVLKRLKPFMGAGKFIQSIIVDPYTSALKGKVEIVIGIMSVPLKQATK